MPSESRRRTRRTLFIAVGAAALLFLLKELLSFIHSCQSAGLPEDSASIIGGADGPTAILVPSVPADIWSAILAAVVLIAAGIGVYAARRK